MSVRKRKWKTRSGEVKEAWLVDYTDQHGKRHVETFARKKDADAAAAEIRIEVGKGTHVAPSDSLTVAEAAERWLAEVRAHRERATHQGYKQHVDLHIVPRIGRVKLAKLTTAGVEKFRNDLLNDADRISRALARKVIVSLKSLLKHAKFAHVAQGVSVTASSRTLRVEPDRDFPSVAEVKRLIDACTKPKQKALVLTAALTGLRASELRGLRWRDIDFSAAELHVRQRADRFCAIGPPKSRSSVRSIPLPPELAASLKAWKIGCPIGDADLVFPTTTGTVVPHTRMLDAFQAIAKVAQVVDQHGEPKYGLHSLRHFFASWCINPKDRGGRELPPKQVQVLLGHSSIVMTLDVYGHLFREGGDRTELAEATRLLLA
jgi:integrase